MVSNVSVVHRNPGGAAIQHAYNGTQSRFWSFRERLALRIAGFLLVPIVSETRCVCVCVVPTFDCDSSGGFNLLRPSHNCVRVIVASRHKILPVPTLQANGYLTILGNCWGFLRRSFVSRVPITLTRVVESAASGGWF